MSPELNPIKFKCDIRTEVLVFFFPPLFEPPVYLSCLHYPQTEMVKKPTKISSI